MSAVSGDIQRNCIPSNTVERRYLGRDIHCLPCSSVKVCLTTRPCHPVSTRTRSYDGASIDVKAGKRDKKGSTAETAKRIDKRFKQAKRTPPPSSKCTSRHHIRFLKGVLSSVDRCSAPWCLPWSKRLGEQQCGTERYFLPSSTPKILFHCTSAAYHPYHRRYHEQN